MDIAPELAHKYQRLQATLRGYGRVAVAFSGGVDSALLLKVAYDTLGERAMALFADSLIQPAEERQGASETARAIGANLEIVAFAPLAVPGFVVNDESRCYHCKKSIFSVFLDLAKERGLPCLIDGTNADDLGAHRPGHRAVKELGVKSPLAEVGLGKREIRLLSRSLGLSTWNKHAASCLATRIVAPRPITLDGLLFVGKAERYLHGLGYHGCRVRLAGTSCYLELVAGDIARLASLGDLAAVRDFLLELGAEKVFLDLLEREGILS